MFVKSLKVSLLLTFTERKITRSPRSVTNFFLPVLENRVNWCRGKLAMSVQLYWKRVIFSDETQVVVGHDLRRTVLVETGRGSLSFTMFVKSLKVSLLLTFT
jgi:hypothetical protein